jgi:hypothetical protein
MPRIDFAQWPLEQLVLCCVTGAHQHPDLPKVL